MPQRLHIVADENIPGLQPLLGDIADIVYLPGRQMQASDLSCADALLVRSITQVNASLLANSKVKFVGSCTIGTDHIDMPWLEQQAIAFANALGCNADAVVDYVLSALLAIEPDLEHWRKRQGVIVGFGQVGSRLYQRLQGLGINSHIYDPFKPEHNASWQDVEQADWLSLHVPLTHQGQAPTINLFDQKRLSRLKPGALLINSSRGKVVDNHALLQALQAGRLKAVLDVYQDEPSPDDQLLQALQFATGHIAGYSLQGKLRGSVMVADALRAFFKKPAQAGDTLRETAKAFCLPEHATAAQAVHLAYDIGTDSQRFKAQVLGLLPDAKAKAFDAYRKHYPVRHELGYLQLDAACAKPLFHDLGFALSSAS